MKISEEVQEALNGNKPVIALESTIITHGMPYPKNVECALTVEKVIRDNGCIPATIGLINGEAVIGLSPEEIDELAQHKNVRKTSRRDLPIVYATKGWGGTTVTTTMLLAKQAGIKFFVTGGIGGVQRGAEKTFDISSDLEELGKTSVCVICAGPKAILDLPKTMEVLETKGVPVIGYGVDTLPAFFTRESDCKVDFNARNPEIIAEICKQKWGNGLEGGVLVCNPIPEEYSMDSKFINKVIDDAINEMDKLGIKGKDETPYLLGKIVELTKGQSLDANIRLVLNNALVGSLIAKEYYKK